MGLIYSIVLGFVVRYGLEIIAITLLVGYLGINQPDVLLQYIEFSKSLINPMLASGIEQSTATAIDSATLLIEGQ